MKTFFKEHGETLAIFGGMVGMACLLFLAQANRPMAAKKSNPVDTCLTGKNITR